MSLCEAVTHGHTTLWDTLLHCHTLRYTVICYYLDTYNEEKQEEHEKLEEAKRQLKTTKLDQMIESGETSEMKARDSDDEDELKYADDVDMPGQKFETKQRITVRNLRIREDTAKVYILGFYPLIESTNLKKKIFRKFQFNL